MISVSWSYLGIVWVNVHHDQMGGSMQARTLRRRYSSLRKPYALRWKTRILLLSPSTKPSGTLFSGWQSSVRANGVGAGDDCVMTYFVRSVVPGKRGASGRDRGTGLAVGAGVAPASPPAGRLFTASATSAHLLPHWPTGSLSDRLLRRHRPRACRASLARRRLLRNSSAGSPTGSKA